MHTVWVYIGTVRRTDGTLRRVQASPDCATRAAAEALARMLRASGHYVAVQVQPATRYGPQR